MSSTLLNYRRRRHRCRSSSSCNRSRSRSSCRFRCRVTITVSAAFATTVSAAAATTVSAAAGRHDQCFRRYHCHLLVDCCLPPSLPLFSAVRSTAAIMLRFCSCVATADFSEIMRFARYSLRGNSTIIQKNDNDESPCFLRKGIFF